jgi:hypothetical protein
MNTKQQTPKFGLCIDWETSGSEWGGDSSKSHQGISFGAIVFDTETFGVVEELSMNIIFDAVRYKWTADAEKIHGLSIEHLNQTGVTQEDAAAELASLILKYWGPDNKVMMLGHNAEFDRRFTNQLLNTIEIEFSVEKETKFDSWIQLHHVILDTASVGFVSFGLFKSDLLFDKIGFDDRGNHNALQDARQTLFCCRAIRELINLAMGEINE